MKFSDPLTTLNYIGEALAKKFAVLGIASLGDLINYFPRQYEDYSEITPINKLKPGLVSLEVNIKQVTGRYTRYRLHITEAIASDSSGSVRLIWFNQPYRANSFKDNQTYFISGKYKLSRGRFSIINPSFEETSEFPTNTARILSVYKETKGLSSRQIRLALADTRPLIRQLAETLPAWLINEHSLMSRAESAEAIHFPRSSEDLALAKRRLGFEEVFNLSLASLLNRAENKNEKALTIKFEESVAKNFVASLPFKLTNDQRIICWNIFKDLELSEPMNRLIEGDVGSGKTVVACMAAAMVINQSKQVAFMAPTEILARQHYATIKKMMSPLSLDDTVCLLVGSLTNAVKADVKKKIKEDKYRIIIGTQALIQESVDMHDLALVIIDEQHRFGVSQRKALMIKAGHMPHVLSLSATPIPRSLALTLYGELDISKLTEKPGGRIPVITELTRSANRAKVLTEVKNELKAGRQAFVVCPLISESDYLEAISVEDVYKEYKEKVFKDYNVGLLHGKLNKDVKNDVMQAFSDHKIDILVATSVIEVGVDVPNASTMLIHSPERFGLAQLHQLRGRVGRGEHQGYCYLLLEDNDDPSARLRALSSSSDGFKLAELDLDIRGPGAIYGTMQHGAIDLRIANLSDTKLISEAVSAARQFIKRKEDLLKYNELNRNVTRLRAVTNLN